MRKLNLINVFQYSTEKYPFRDCIEEIIQEKDLENLHKSFDFYLLERKKDQTTSFHKSFYSNYKGSRFEGMYESFIKEYVTTLLKTNVINQAKPTFRVHMPNNLGVGEFHRDSDYDHPLEEINFLIPVTEAKQNSTIWIESAQGKEDFSPVDLRYGDCMVFRGGLLKHGNKINDTGRTRASFDFRVVPKDQFQPSTAISINTGLKFEVGEYYNFLK